MYRFLKGFEKAIIIILTLMMVVVLSLATIDLGWLILQDVLSPPVVLLNVNELLDIFGAFMLVIIGIELLATIMKTYLAGKENHLEVVVSVAIIAIARKVIILDIEKVGSLTIIGIAAVIVALTAGFYLLRRSRGLRKPPPGGEQREP